MDNGPFAVGSRVRVCQPKLLPAVWQVTELDEGRRMFTWATRAPGVQITGLHQVKGIGSRIRATLSLQFSGLLGPLAARFYRSLNERYLAIETKGVKERSEGFAL